MTLLGIHFLNQVPRRMNFTTSKLRVSLVQWWLLFIRLLADILKGNICNIWWAGGGLWFIMLASEFPLIFQNSPSKTMKTSKTMKNQHTCTHHLAWKLEMFEVRTIESFSVPSNRLQHSWVKADRRTRTLGAGNN